MRYESIADVSDETTANKRCEAHSEADNANSTVSNKLLAMMI